MHRLGGLEHQRPNHEMTQRQRLNLLNHSRWRLAPQLRRLGRPPRVLMGLLLVVDLFLFPPFVIENDQLFSRMKCFIQEIRNNNMSLAMTDPLGFVQRVTDHSDQDAVAVPVREVLPPLFPGEIAVGDLPRQTLLGFKIQVPEDHRAAASVLPSGAKATLWT